MCVDGNATAVSTNERTRTILYYPEVDASMGDVDFGEENNAPSTLPPFPPKPPKPPKPPFIPPNNQGNIMYRNIGISHAAPLPKPPFWFSKASKAGFIPLSFPSFPKM